MPSAFVLLAAACRCGTNSPSAGEMPPWLNLPGDISPTNPWRRRRKPSTRCAFAMPPPPGDSTGIALCCRRPIPACRKNSCGRPLLRAPRCRSWSGSCGISFRRLSRRRPESERIEADSRNLLSADIAAVYGQTDEELAKSAIKNARRMARSDAKVVPIRRRRRRIFYVLGAMAACLALFMLVRYGWYPRSYPQVANEPTVVALLVVEPELAPPSLREARLPTGDLAQRLAEARVRAEGLPVVALLSVREPHGVVSDSAIPAGFELRQAQEAHQEPLQGSAEIALQKIAGSL